MLCNFLNSSNDFALGEWQCDHVVRILFHNFHAKVFTIPFEEKSGGRELVKYVS